MRTYILLAFIFALSAFSAQALDYKIVAIVDGKSISNVQVDDRTELVMKTSGIEDNAANREKTKKEVLDVLINEILQKQDADAKGIKVSEKEIEEVLSNLEQRNNLKAGELKKFLSGKGIPYGAMKDQVVATIIWKKILQTYVRPDVEITDEDIKKAEAEIAAKPKIIPKTFVKISEIILPVELEKEQEAKDLAETISRTVKSGGEKFDVLAKKYSAGKTAAKGGAVGWLPQDGMADPIGPAVRATKTGDVSKPILTNSMYVIVKVDDRKTDAPADEKISGKELAVMKRMDAAAKKYIKALRDNAFIENKAAN